MLVFYGLFNFLFKDFIQGRPQNDQAACPESTTPTRTLTNGIIVFEEAQTGDVPTTTDTNTYIEPKNSEKLCPTQLLNKVSAELKDRSLCPWFTVLNRNQFRVPRIIKEARCRCSKCVVPSSDSFAGDCQCEQIFENIKVLKRTAKCSNGQFVYRLQVERIPVGCACAIRRQAMSSESPA
ncbi:hypothetical protein FSP39_012211 [Pinctada imbricata]|uniref:Interleukin 17-like protein n=1 Tax=Pinctada imbricata TaxID=66713 RepID=A0AA88XRQ4_PINIB|nr:hypothetical protein FSP39_012211 [Pinctada imbricata]